jgi:hypothetical protein
MGRFSNRISSAIRTGEAFPFLWIAPAKPIPQASPHPWTHQLPPDRQRGLKSQFSCLHTALFTCGNSSSCNGNEETTLARARSLATRNTQHAIILEIKANSIKPRIYVARTVGCNRNHLHPRSLAPRCPAQCKNEGATDSVHE